MRGHIAERLLGAWWRRLPAAVVLAYLAAYAVEIALGNRDPRRVGWGTSSLPVFVEAAVFGAVMRGIWGVLLAPLPLLAVPETWARLQTLMHLVGPLGLALLLQPLPVGWLGGALGALVAGVGRRFRQRR